MFYKCPGQNSRNLSLSYYKCLSCGNEIEIFSDELKAKCLKCNEIFYREQKPSCISWCSAARQCIGEEKWKELTENTRK